MCWSMLQPCDVGRRAKQSIRRIEPRRTKRCSAGWCQQCRTNYQAHVFAPTRGDILACLLNQITLQPVLRRTCYGICSITISRPSTQESPLLPSSLWTTSYASLRLPSATKHHRRLHVRDAQCPNPQPWTPQFSLSRPFPETRHR
jgi:hypothetical protein